MVKECLMTPHYLSTKGSLWLLWQQDHFHNPPKPDRHSAKKEAVKRAPLIVLKDTSINRKIIIRLSATIPTTLSNIAVFTPANTILASASIKIVLADHIQHKHILLTTTQNTAASEAKQYYDSLSFALRSLVLDVSRSWTNSRWPQVIIREITTSISSSDVASAITESDHHFTLNQCHTSRGFYTPPQT